MVEIILITEICKDASKKLVNNEGKNHVCLYNYFTRLYMSINKTLIHLSKKSWMICLKTFVFATPEFHAAKSNGYNQRST